MKVLITGSSGYIGSVLAKFAERSGHQVMESTRDPKTLKQGQIFLDLNQPEKINIPPGIGMVVHLAANTSGDLYANKSNEILFARNLVCEAKRVGASFIFLSSQSASKNAVSEYGQIKWEIEQEVLRGGGCVIRPGLVYGGDSRGLFGTLLRLVKKCKVLPKFYPEVNVQPIHIDDLCFGILSLCNSSVFTPRIFCLGDLQPIEFNKFLSEIAWVRYSTFRIFIPLPSFLIKILRSFSPNKSFLSNWLIRLESLIELKSMNVKNDLNYLNISPCRLATGLSKSGFLRRRDLFLEGRLFIRVVGAKPSPFTLRRYARSIENARSGYALALPKFMLLSPYLFMLVKLNNAPRELYPDEIKLRIDIATLISEATIAGGRRVFGDLPTKFKWNKALFHILYLLFCEANRKLLSLTLQPIIMKYLHSWAK